jgi:translation initiation factor IF-3
MKYQFVNEQIQEKTVQLVMDDGVMRGQVPTYIAIKLAEERELDLVQVAPADGEKPPICKLLDYGKVRYKDSKNNKKKKSNKTVTKEIKFRFNISEHDMGTKSKQIIKFLSKKYYVRFTLELRGRYRYMKEVAREKMAKNLEAFEGLASWDKVAENDNNLSVTLKPVGK